MGDYAHTLTVRYAETDSQGVVFNSHYQALCDAVFDLWVRDRMGKAWQKEVGVHFSMVVASRFQYRSPAVFLDELTIRGEVTRWGRTSFEVSWLGDVPGEREGDPQRRIFEGVMTYVCVDEPSGADQRGGVPAVLEITTPRLGIVRFHGQNRSGWRRGSSVHERFNYLYSPGELQRWVRPMLELSRSVGSSGQVHAVFNNCVRNYAVLNAKGLSVALEESAAEGR